MQTPNTISSSQGETRAPGRLCVQSADPWGCRPLLISPHHPFASRLVGVAQTTPTRSSLGTGCMGHSAPLHLTRCPTERTLRRELPSEGPRRPVPRARPLPTVSPKVASLQQSWVALCHHPQAMGPARGSGAPGCLVGGVPAEKAPIEGRRVQEGVGGCLGPLPAEGGELEGQGAGTRPACGGGAWGGGGSAPRGLGAPTVVLGLGSVQSRRPCPSSGPLFGVWAPSGLPSTWHDSVSVPAARGCPRGSRQRVFMAPQEEPVGGLGAPGGWAERPGHTHHLLRLLPSCEASPPCPAPGNRLGPFGICPSDRGDQRLVFPGSRDREGDGLGRDWGGPREGQWATPPTPRRLAG